MKNWEDHLCRECKHIDEEMLTAGRVQFPGQGFCNLKEVHVSPHGNCSKLTLRTSEKTEAS